MKLRHATPIGNIPSILKSGLLCSKSKGKLKVVWAHVPSKSSWAAIHVVKRHGGKIEDVVVLEVDLPRSWLRRNRRGLWYSTRDVTANRIKKTIRFAELAASPVEVNG